jgi:hypothetical protein
MGWNDCPIGICLQASVRRRRPGILVIDKAHMVANKALVIDRHAFTDESMRTDLAAGADAGVSLNLNERPDSCAVTD